VDSASQCIIAVDHQQAEIVLSCRGTSNLGTWFTNLRALLKSVPGIDPKFKFHTGWLDVTIYNYTKRL